MSSKIPGMHTMPHGAPPTSGQDESSSPRFTHIDGESIKANRWDALRAGFIQTARGVMALGAAIFVSLIYVFTCGKEIKNATPKEIGKYTILSFKSSGHCFYTAFNFDKGMALQGFRERLNDLKSQGMKIGNKLFIELAEIHQ